MSIEGIYLNIIKAIMTNPQLTSYSTRSVLTGTMNVKFLAKCLMVSTQ